MKKFILIAGVIGLAVLTLGVVSPVFAQEDTPPPTTGYGHGYGMMGGRNGYGGMRGAWQGEEHGPYHEYMLEVFSEVLGLTVDQIESRLDSGETMWQIAAAEDLSSQEFAGLMLQARQAMLDQAVADGLLSQEQADFMASRWTSRGAGAGFGNCSGYGSQSGLSRGPRGRWDTP